jgi:hypothetical protein
VKQIRKRLTYANVMSSIAVFLVLGGGAAFAASKLAKNSVGTKQLKNNSVTTKKIKKNAVTTAKIKNNAVTGAKVNEATLGTVPSATTAANLTGQTPFFIRLGFGQTQLIVSNGTVSLTAVCTQEGGEDIARIVMATSQNGAVADAANDFDGEEPANFLNTTTPELEREFVTNSVGTGLTDVENDTGEGFVLGPDGKMLTANGEGIALGLNYGNAGCLFAGVINAVG